MSLTHLILAAASLSVMAGGTWAVDQMLDRYTSIAEQPADAPADAPEETDERSLHY